MKRLVIFLSVVLFSVTTISAQVRNGGLVNTTQSPYVVMQSTKLDDVRWTHGFWNERFNVVRDTMVPELFNTYMSADISHAFRNFEIAAGLATGSHKGPPFHDGDFYKVLESLISIYSVTKKPELNQQLDKVIAVIAKSQLPNGYIHTPVVIEERKETREVVAFEERLNFETYNLGHLMTAGCLHFRVTGKRSLLDVAIKATDFLYNFYKTASPELARNAICPSHYMGVVEMFRTTRNPKYLELSKSLIDIRGLVENGTDYNQDRIPFRDQTVAMGHAVRATYLYAGVADVIAETGDATLLKPLNLIWDNMVNTKMYITGACGALYDGISPDGTSYNPSEIQRTQQTFGRDFQLPNQTAHNETCANIGNMLWNWRMFLITGEAKYVDIVELTLYNSILSGVSLNGKDFFYTNPLALSDDFPYVLRWSGGRIPYIALSNCCPPNTTRTLAQVQNYAYSTSKDALWVNLYGGNEFNTIWNNGRRLQVKQTSDYPWDGNIKLEFAQVPGKDFSIFLRIPGWSDSATLKVNGKPEPANLTAESYVEVNRNWKRGDIIELYFPMEAKLMGANPLVEEVRNQVAVKRGPVVYCLESTDIPGTSVFDVILPVDIKLTPKKMDLEGSPILALEGISKALEKPQHNTLFRQVTPATRTVPVRLIPYYAWGNRGKSEMTVWMNVSY